MQAVYIQKYGPADVLEIGEQAIPVPADGECRVKIAASSVNPIDWKLRSGMLRFIKRLRFPYIPGGDFCGEVVEAGPGVSRFKAGDEVYGMLDLIKGGGYAEYAVVPESALAHKPPQLNTQEAAALPLVALASLQAMCDKGNLSSGDHVLVIGASGGVGHIAVQIAKALGARVTAVCGSSNVAWVSSLGADRVIDYHKESYKDAGETYDLVFDVVAVDSYSGCSKILKPSGVYVTTLPGPGIAFASLLLPLFSKKRAHFFEVKPSASGLEQVSRMVAENGLKPKIAKVIPLTETKTAHEESEAGHVSGKLVLNIATV